MKRFQWIGLLIGMLIIFSPGVATAHHGKSMTRASFIKLVVSEKFSQEEIKACDINDMPFHDIRMHSRMAPSVCMAYKNQFIKSSPTFRPAARLTLAEAAAILQNAFDLDIPEYTPFPGTWPHYSDRSPWYEAYLRALEEQNAIPISFWKPNDMVMNEEATEIISRLAESDTTKPSMTFEALQSQKNRYRAKDAIRFHGDFREPLEGEVITSEFLRLLQEPGTYYIDDIAASEQDYTNYCHNFYTQSGVRGNATLVKQGDDAMITIEALSGDYCVFPFPDKQPGECPPDAQYGDDPRCNRGQAKPYTLILEKKDGKLFVKGAETDRIRISRAPIERLCREFAEGCPAGLYDYTKVKTVGSLSTMVTARGETWNVYKTVWQSIFGDLRGVPFFRFEKTLADGSYFSKYYEVPDHNRNAWGYGFASYEDCIISNPVGSSIAGVNFHFCIKRAGNDFVIASPYELGDRLTLWIDSYYRR